MITTTISIMRTGKNEEQNDDGNETDNNQTENSRKTTIGS
jgi:hypothetical protein